MGGCCVHTANVRRFTPFCDFAPAIHMKRPTEVGPCSIKPDLSSGSTAVTGRLNDHRYRSAKRQPLPVVGTLAMRHDVEAFALLVIRDTQAHDQICDLEGDEGDDCRPHDRYTNRLGLHDKLIHD